MDLITQEGTRGGGLRGDGAAGLGTGLAALVDELAHGTLVATPEGRMLLANHAARRELARSRTLVLLQGVVQALDAKSDHQLQLALLRAGEGKRSLVRLQASEGAPLPVAVLPLKAGPGEPVRAALIFARSAVCDPLMLCFFARSHGLTPTEEQVLGILCEGYSAPQAARQLNVAVSTVRSHVRSLCAKTRCSSVREVVGRVAVLPPVAPAFCQEAVH